jgi:putative salt-induced outer membrane protein YdiY
MNLRTAMSFILLLSLLLVSMSSAHAETATSTLEQSMSDTLDLWREGRYEQLYERLSHRGKTSKEQFVARMRDTARRPACCWQKMENFRVLNEKRTEATVYVKVGLEGTPSPVESSTRDFKLSHDS